MSAAPDLAPGREFRTLARKLQAARGFCFIVFFVEDPRASLPLKRSLANWLERQARPLTTVSAEAPGDLAVFVLGGIFDAQRAAADSGGRPVVWVEAFRHAGDVAWEAERRRLLMRMNERRSRFESGPGMSLILLLPAGAERDAASLAPDLWHVRLHSARLSVDRTAALHPERTVTGPQALPFVAPSAAAPSADDPPEVVFWNAVRDAAQRAADDDPQALGSLSLWDGFEAVRAWWRMNRPQEAVTLAEDLVYLGRQRWQPGGADAAEARRELAVALREYGDSLLYAARPQQAVEALNEGIQLARQGDTSSGRDPVATQTLATLLCSLGDVLLRLGRPKEAEAVFEESLALVRRLPHTIFPTVSPVVVMFIDRLGDAALAAGNAEKALAAYRESVALQRRQHQDNGALGDDPTSLGSLGKTLVRLGDAEWDTGQGERAMTTYGDSLAMLRQRLSLGPADAQAQSDLAFVLIRVAQVELVGGRVAPALTACEEAAGLWQSLAERGAPTTRLATELSKALQQIAQAAPVASGSGAADATDSLAATETATRLLAAVLGTRTAPE